MEQTFCTSHFVLCQAIFPNTTNQTIKSTFSTTRQQKPNVRRRIQMSTTPTTRMWRSKLGNDYDMAFIERNDSRTKAELDRLRRHGDNMFCADCGRKGTVWASVNLGVFLCMTCGSHHRGIGTHISKPKGCTGTYLWGPDEIAQMTAIGNTRAAQLYGATSAGERPPPDATDATWRNFLIEKYEQQHFAPAASLQQPESHGSWERDTHINNSVTKTLDTLEMPHLGKHKHAQERILLAQKDRMSRQDPSSIHPIQLQSSAPCPALEPEDFFANFGL